MHDKLKDWFKNDYWSHEEAACLMCGINPRTNHGVSFINGALKVGNIEILTGGKSIDSTLKLFNIFESANWKNISSDSSENGKRIWCDYFKMAELKGMKVHIALLNAKDSFEKQNENKLMKQKITNDNNDEIIHFSQKMNKVLEPIADVINEFKNSPKYKKYGKDLSQNLITEWLEEIGYKRHEQRYLKELISKYYDIKSLRK